MQSMVRTSGSWRTAQSSKKCGVELDENGPTIAIASPVPWALQPRASPHVGRAQPLLNEWVSGWTKKKEEKEIAKEFSLTIFHYGPGILYKWSSLTYTEILWDVLLFLHAGKEPVTSEINFSHLQSQGPNSGPRFFPLHHIKHTLHVSIPSSIWTDASHQTLHPTPLLGMPFGLLKSW